MSLPGRRNREREQFCRQRETMCESSSFWGKYEQLGEAGAGINMESGTSKAINTRGLPQPPKAGSHGWIDVEETAQANLGQTGRSPHGPGQGVLRAFSWQRGTVRSCCNAQEIQRESGTNIVVLCTERLTCG